MKKLLVSLAFLGSVLGLAGCANTSIKQSWKSPEHQGGPAKQIAVLAVEERILVRRALENRFVTQFNRVGQPAQNTEANFGLPEIKADKQGTAAKLQAAGNDAILVIRWVDQTTYSREVEATPHVWVPTVTGFGTCGWYDYFSLAYTDMGTTWGSTRQDIYLDCSLFDLKTSQRVWSALTRTVVREETDKLAEADALVAKIADRLRADGMIR